MSRSDSMQKLFVVKDGMRWCSVTLPALILALAAGTVPAAEGDIANVDGFAEGSVSAADPYAIEDWYDLDDVRDDLDGDYVLVADLDESTAGYDDVASETANGGEGFDPIGNTGNEFTGTFDGDGHTISNLYINRTDGSNVGLFGHSTGDLSDVSLEGVDIEGDADLNNGVGALAGRSEGAVSDVTVSGTVDGDRRVGGLIGTVRGDGTVSDSSASAAVTTGSIAGGLVGEARGSEILRSYTTGDVDGDNTVGGLVGINSQDISESYATGDVDGDNYVGGLVGENWGNISESYATGDVDGDDFVGGLVGGNWGYISDSYWDRGTTNREDAIGEDSGSSSGLEGFGFTIDTDPADEMTGNDAESNMYRLDFSTTWETVTADDADASDDSYPILTALDRGAQLNEQGVGLYAAGEGTVENPYVITDWHHLDSVRENLDANFTLGNDLDEDTPGYDDVASETANDGDGFEPIGKCNEAGGCDPDFGASPFSGTFDGNDTEISGLVINTENSENGLFGAAGDGATIENVRLHDIDIDIGTADDFPSTGGIVGFLTDGEITRSSVTGEIVSSQGSTTGVGGLVGENWGGAIDQSYANTTVTGGDDHYVGGLVGLNFDDTLFHGTGSISDSYATGDVSGGADDFGTGVGTGGLVGVNSGDISNSYATGDVDADENVGGLVGANSGDITSSYWDDQAATVTEDGEAQDGQGVGDGGGDVTALTTSEMTGVNAIDNMAFDFADTWGVVDEPEDGNVVSYPFLQTAIQDPAPGLQTRYAGGDGDANPYEITDWAELDNVRENLDANFTLVDDLNESAAGYNDLVDTSDGFEPIGDSDDEFTGTFDGDGHTISALYINRRDGSNVGLFGHSTGDLSNVALEGVDIEGNSDSNKGVGALAGRSEGAVSNVTVSGTVDGDPHVGGLIGSLRGNGTVSDSSASVAVTATGDNAGGLVGESWGEILRSNATGDVNGGDQVGGLVGWNEGTISESYATGGGNGGYYVGGLVGENYGDISESYATGDVEGTTYGGLVGINAIGGDISESYAIGSVLVGSGRVGGLVGENEGAISNSYWDRGTTNQEDAIGDDSGSSSGLEGFGSTGDTDPAEEMTGLSATGNMSAFAYPDGGGTWHVVEDDYPALAWEDTEAFFGVNITETNSPINEGDTLEVTAQITNWAAYGEQTVTLTDTDFSNVQQDLETVQLESGGIEAVNLEWATEVGNADTGDVTVASENDTGSETVTIDTADIGEPRPIPTASAWGLAVLSLLLALIGYRRISAP